MEELTAAADLTNGPLFCDGTVVLVLGPPKLAMRLRLAPLLVGEYCSGIEEDGGVATVVVNKIKKIIFRLFKL